MIPINFGSGTNSSISRKYEEKILVANWLHKVELFQNLPNQINLELAGRTGVKYYNQDEISPSKSQIRLNNIENVSL